MDISFELSMAPSYDYTWLLSFYFVQLSSLQAEILNVKEKIVPIFMVFQLAWIPLRYIHAHMNHEASDSLHSADWPELSAG